MTADRAPVRSTKANRLNVANALTLARLLLVPVFAVLLVSGSAPWRLAAVATFVVAALTDRVDGELARRRGLVTDLGKIADPIADKALIGTALVGLSALGELAWWVSGVILLREIGVTLLRSSCFGTASSRRAGEGRRRRSRRPPPSSYTSSRTGAPSPPLPTG